MLPQGDPEVFVHAGEYPDLEAISIDVAFVGEGSLLRLSMRIFACVMSAL